MAKKKTETIEENSIEIDDLDSFDMTDEDDQDSFGLTEEDDDEDYEDEEDMELSDDDPNTPHFARSQDESDSFEGDDSEDDVCGETAGSEAEEPEETLDFSPEAPESDETIPEKKRSHSKDTQQEEELSFDNKSSKAKWYVVHTYSGHENKVKANIEKIVENRGMQDLVLSIVVPTEDHVEIKAGQRKIKTRKMFPGYVIVKMIVTNESWYLVRNTQGVTGFVGHGTEPVPLTNEEVRRMGIEKVYVKIDVDVGDSIKVINGPFESFMGVVEEVNLDKQTLKVRISMFGRDTPVELEFGQIDKL